MISIIDAGIAHTLARRRDGTVWAWGANGSGQLGMGSTSPVLLPTLAGLSGRAAGVATGNAHSLALVPDPKGVFAWGSNQVGQIGDGDAATTRVLPAKVALKSGASAIAGGASHSLAIYDETVFAWGSNVVGELGIGEVGAPVPIPRPVAGQVHFKSLAAGAFFSLALTKTGGEVYAWGHNAAGQLGFNTGGNPQTTPRQIPEIKGAIAIASGSYHSMAIRRDGTVVGFGNNDLGQLGLGATVTAPVTSIPKLKGIIAVAAGTWHSLALDKTGRVFAAGLNVRGQLGINSMDYNRTSFFRVPLDAQIVAIGAGNQHSLAVDSDGRVWAWGDNFQGQLGDGSTVAFRTVPGLVAGLADVGY